MEDMIMRRFVVAIGMCALLALGAACGDDGAKAPEDAAIDPADFQSAVDNEFFPLEPGATFVYEGEEVDPDTGKTIELRVESTVLEAKDVVAGVEVTVVEVRDIEDGELVELTRDYYAQHSDGTVYYLGEDVDDYEDGEVVGHSGQWLAGEGDNLPGVFMPASPAGGDEFEQERAPGLAEDRSKVIDIDQPVTTAAGEFSGCIKTEDYDPIGGATEFKYYCPGVGLVREESEDGESFIELVSR
jgi:hypothetical protein